MLQRAWSYVLYLYGLVSFWRCENPEKLEAGHINMQQYYGNWYFIAVSTDKKSTMETFTFLDNTVYHLGQGDTPNRMLLQAAIRLGSDQCMFRKWVYRFDNQTEDLILEGRPEMQTEVILAKCSDCIVLQESQQRGSQQFKRSMLYARTTSLDQESIDDFMKKAKCSGMDEFFILPQNKEYCDIEST